ncbi:MAG: S41 family peptidase [Sphingomonas phyllosphaerae]
MRKRRSIGLVAGLALLASCGDGGGGTSVGSSAGGGGGGSVAGTTTATGCALRARQNWVLAAMNEWYLFPDTLPTNIDPARYSDVDSFLDALTATARAQRKDRYFTYLTSLKAENAYYSSGGTAGIGVRLARDSNNRLFVTEAYEGAPALTAGIDRGAQIVGIGPTAATVRLISDILASGGETALDAAFDTSTPGTVRVLRITDASGTRDVPVTSADYTLTPVSSRYGSKVLDDNGRKVGYINLRTFISTADDQLRSAFGAFRAQGVTQVIVDLRYNGGGLLDTAETFTDLLGANRSTSDVQAYTTFRTSKSTQNQVRRFAREMNAIAPTRVAFIGTGQTASASEYVINALIPYLHGDLALVGSNTYGKPVGQIPLDNPSCSDDRLRVIAFALQNAARQGDYYDGLATKVEASCQATDDYNHQLGDASETSVRTALDWLAGRGCTAIGASASAARITGLFAPSQRPLVAVSPTIAQRETPGLY